MTKNFVVDVGEEAKQLALVKAAEAQRRLGRRVTLQKTVETAIKLLDIEAFVKYLEEENK